MDGDIVTGRAGTVPLGTLQVAAEAPRRIAERLFAAGDAEAGRHGWQIIRTCGGFGRRYRNPMFDTLAASRRARSEVTS